MNEIILLKLGEMVLKGLNRRSFEDKLQANLHRRLRPFGQFRVYTRQSATYVEPIGEGCDVEGAYGGPEARVRHRGSVPGPPLREGQGRHPGLRQGISGRPAPRRPHL